MTTGGRADYGEADFARAVERVGGEARPAALTEPFGVDWDYVAWIGLGFAEELLGPAPGGDPRVPNGAEAFAAGLLIGLYLPPGPRRHDAGGSLPAAVESVRERGRHAIIADHCDLGAVASFETVYAASLVEALGLGEEERTALLEPFTRLFESGLATGLVLGSSAS